jgi:hypothetical protein
MSRLASSSTSLTKTTHPKLGQDKTRLPAGNILHRQCIANYPLQYLDGFLVTGFCTYFKMGNILLVQSIRTKSEEGTFQGDWAVTNGTKLGINRGTTRMRHIYVSMIPTLSTQTQSFVLEETSKNCTR